MRSTTNLHVMLAYVAYPVTTAVYIERALRQLGRVTTIGPALPEELISEWDLESIRGLMYQQDIPTGFNPDMAEVLQKIAPENMPDLYLWVESVGGHFPANLESLPCPKACYLIDSHLKGIEWHLQWARLFDYVFIAQREYLPQFRAVNPNSYWLPLGCDPEIHTRHNVPVSHDISFVGGTMFNPRRSALLDTLAGAFKLHKERCFLEEMTKVFSASKIVFNSAVRNDLNMRVFEVLATGAFQLTDIAKNSGLTELFRDGEELAYYHCDAELGEVADFYLKNAELREQIAARGRQVVLKAHTYRHRMEDLLAVVGGNKTDTWSVLELRARSVAGVEPLFRSYRYQQSNISTQSRSFVIPVLDYSPASEFNIGTLLTDLENIPGDVIVVFNDQGVAAELKDHPRITRFAIMSQNIGVARAWNVGIEMATTPVVFILNSDLHLELEAVNTVERGLMTLENAACTGPQGSFVNFRLCRDYYYFDKGSFNAAIEVDAVSGFYFAVKREHFAPGGLRFEDAYTPCYFEEWDLGLQIKRAGLKSYVVPTTAYCHHWSGSIAARREIECMGRSETPQGILLRNRQLFLTKWLEIGLNAAQHPFDTSGFSTFCRGLILEYLRNGMNEDAAQAARHFADKALCMTELKILAGFALGHCGHSQEALQYFKKVLATDPAYDLDAAVATLSAQLNALSA
jgi:GT2 family glycosyltransferase